VDVGAGVVDGEDVRGEVVVGLGGVGNAKVSERGWSVAEVRGRERRMRKRRRVQDSFLPTTHRLGVRDTGFPGVY